MHTKKEHFNTQQTQQKDTIDKPEEDYNGLVLNYILKKKAKKELFSFSVLQSLFLVCL